MSKYEKSIDYEPEEKSPLIPGEELIWSGKPKKKAFIINKSLFMLPFALLWLAFDSFMIITMFSTGAISEMLFFIIPFFLFHLMPVWIWLGNVVTANKRWKNTKYYVTDKRIIIKNGFFAENYQTIYYKDIRNVNLSIGLIDKLLGVGDIHFDVTRGNVYNGQPHMGAAFLDIEDSAYLYQKLQKVVLDIQTDIEYPNALRPETNPGYNTKYEPKEK